MGNRNTLRLHPMWKNNQPKDHPLVDPPLLRGSWNMPNPGSDEPLTKITLNIFTKDLKEIKRIAERGPQPWTAWLREGIREYLEEWNEHNQ